MTRTSLCALTLVLALAPAARALPVDWSGTWSVDGAEAPRVLEETLPGQLTVTARLPIEGEDRWVELSGSATPEGLALETQWIDGIGIVGFLENVHLKARHRVTLRATVTRRGAEVVAEAVLALDGHEVRRETWRTASGLELVGLEARGAPLDGALDLEGGGPLVVKFRVLRGATPVRARVVVAPGHPYASFYGGVGATVRSTSLGVLEPGAHELPWDGRDATPARRLALGGAYRLVLEPCWPVARDAGPTGDGLPLPPRQAAAAGAGAVSASFAVAAPRVELLCSDWPANYADVQRPRWNEGPSLAQAARFLTTAPGGAPGFAFEGPRVLSDAVVAAGYMKRSSFALLETHGNVDSVWFFKGDPAKPWERGDPEDGITGRYFSPGDLRDLHFALALICDGGVRDPEGRSFASQLREAGCDVAIAFEATIDTGESRRFRDVLLRLVADGAPVEKAARDAVRVTFSAGHPQATHFLFVTTGQRSPTDDEMDALIDAERAAPADPKVNYGIKSLASSLVVERGPGIPADESMWPPRHGNSTN